MVVIGPVTIFASLYSSGELNGIMQVLDKHYELKQTVMSHLPEMLLLSCFSQAHHDLPKIES